VSVVLFLYRDTGPCPRLFSTSMHATGSLVPTQAGRRNLRRPEWAGRCPRAEVHRHSLPRSCRRSLLETCRRRLLLLQRLLMLPAEEVLHSTSTILMRSCRVGDTARRIWVGATTTATRRAGVTVPELRVRAAVNVRVPEVRVIGDSRRAGFKVEPGSH
jgi:hypothetical protein